MYTWLRKFSIDQNEEIETNFAALDRGLSVLGAGEYNGNIILFAENERQNTITVFDATSERFIGELPNDFRQYLFYSSKELKIIVRNNLAIMIDYSTYII